MDFNYQTISPDGVAVFASDSQLLVRFKTHAELSQHKSKLAGAPIYDDIEIVEILNPGEKEPIIVQVDDFLKRRFPKQYEAFKKGQDHVQSGTPLELLFMNQPSTVKQLKAFNIYSVQQLANIDDNAISQIPMGRTLVDKAKEYLRNAGAGQSFHAMEAMKKEIEALKARLEEGGIPAPETPAFTNEPSRRGPGRPRKEKETV